MTRTPLKKAPYDRNGSLINWVSSYPDHVHEWRENKPFPAWLTVQGIQRGMSAARFTWTDTDGHTFPMFMTDMVDLLKRAPDIRHGHTYTWWMVQKRGKNYGIRLATVEELQAAGHDTKGLGLPPYPTSGPAADI
ncbi:hypothetical protein ACH4S8_37395 [Streptomyces sp. NPDC021080]|uniref:hypothetical protein n=1 Tax=Streptomyces sp. NPDC021080 TaxID=3365110 RepID=UPI0037A22A4A